MRAPPPCARRREAASRARIRFQRATGSDEREPLDRSPCRRSQVCGAVERLSQRFAAGRATWLSSGASSGHGFTVAQQRRIRACQRRRSGPEAADEQRSPRLMVRTAEPTLGRLTASRGFLPHRRRATAACFGADRSFPRRRSPSAAAAKAPTRDGHACRARARELHAPWLFTQRQLLSGHAG